MKGIYAKKIAALVLSIILVSFLFVGCSGGNTAPQKPKTSNIMVIVRDNSGNALSGATVSLDSLSGETDASGKYVFKNVKEGNYTVKSEKDGYESDEKDISVSAGKDQTVNLVLKKKEQEVQVEPLKDISKIKSYRSTVTVKSTSNPADNSKIVIEQDDYGKKQLIIVYDKDGKKTFEIYVVGDKAKVSQDGNGWMEVPGAMVGQFTQNYLNSFKSFQSEALEKYNGWVKTPEGTGSYTVEPSGNEVANGYSAVKYIIKGKGTSSSGTETGLITIWVIDKGPYKDYVTRIVIQARDSSGNNETITIDTTDFGKDMGIKLP